jgi:hypothetical protein
LPNPPRPERPDAPDGKFNAAQMAWALQVIGWEKGHAAFVLHTARSSIHQMTKGTRLIPDNLAEWLNVLAMWHLRLWQPKRWPLNLPSEPQGRYGGNDMKRAMARIGWKMDMVLLRLNLPPRLFYPMLKGRTLIPDGLSLWLEALAEMHETYPQPLGWRAKVPQEEWLAERGTKSQIDAA